MAENLHDNFIERDRRVEIVGKLFLDTGYSTRKISKLISLDERYDFSLSNATVADYILRYKNKHPEHAEQIDSLIEANKGSSVKNKEDIKRVLEVSKLVLMDYSIEDIATKLNASYWVVYYDIHIRLPKINNELYNEVILTLENHARNHNTR